MGSGFLSRLTRRTDGPDIVPSAGWQAWLTTLAAGVMSFLAVLAISAGMAADKLAAEWRADLTGVATVRVAGPIEGREARVQRVLDVLSASPGVASAHALSDAEQEALLAPWLGDAAGLEGLPAPRLIDVRLEDAGPDPTALRAQLRLTDEHADYDDHQSWRGPLTRAAAALERLSWLATGLVVVAASVMVALAARATLAGNLEIVRVIRLIGGEDRFIAGSFVGRLAARAGIGGFLGAIGALVAINALPSLGPEIGLSAALAPDRGAWFAMALGIPLAASLIARLTARLTIRAALRKLL